MSMTCRGILGITLALLAAPVFADGAIEQLVRETGIEPGPVAMRDFEGWQPPRRIVIRGPEDLIAELGQEFPDVELVGVSSRADVARAAPGADAIIGFCSREILEAASNVVWVQIFSAGADRCVPLEPINNGEVVLTNMQKMSSPVLAEHAIAMLLTLARGLVPYAKTMETGEWHQRGSAMTDRMQTVSGKTVLVVGLGGIGIEVAKRAHALGMRVIGTRRSSREGPDFVDYVGLSDELHALAAEADVIVNALPLTPATRGLFDREFFAAARKGVLFVSVGRGASTVTDDLIAALDSGQVGGAGLDVTDPEPLPSDNRLWQMENVIITPHVAGVGGTTERHFTLVRENIRRFIAGDPLLNVVDPQLGY